MFTEFAQTYQGNFLDFNPYPKASDRTGWEQLDPEAKAVILVNGENYLHYSFPYITAMDFMEFSKTGNRTNYENKLFSKRLALNALVLAECLENKDRFMDDIINGIFAICDETAWQLPAHNTYVRDTPQLPLPDTTKPVLDLFACETASILAVTYYLLKDKLDTVSPFICTRIEQEIRFRILMPYVSKHFWWMGRGKEPMCNWTIWCTQNILLSTFLLPCPAYLKTRIFKKACKSTDYFLKDYSDDGCCDEGAQYYRHAGLCLYQTLDILCQVTDKHFSPLWENNKIKNIASYIFNVHVDDKYYINFADCSPIAGRAGIREFLFAKACQLPQLKAFAAMDYQANTEKFQPAENNLYYRLQELFTHKEILSETIPKDLAHSPVYYEGVGLFIARNEHYTMAAKAGHNDDNHNHNDTGSITLYKNGLPVLVDIGVESYTKKTFSAQRYEIWTMQSDYHNLPTLNGQMQKDGRSFHAVVLGHSFTPNGGTFQMDIARAYPTQTHISSYIRNAVLTNDGFFLSDHWCFTPATGTDKPYAENNVIQNFITYEKPVIEKHRILLGSLAVMELPDEADITIEELPITDARLQLCWKHSLYRIRIQTTGEHFSIKIY